MSEESSNLATLRPANSPNGFDLRRVGSHPDYWYPLAWSDELKVGKALGRRFAGDPIVIYRGAGGQVRKLRCERANGGENERGENDDEKNGLLFHP